MFLSSSFKLYIYIYISTLLGYWLGKSEAGHSCFHSSLLDSVFFDVRALARKRSACSCEDRRVGMGIVKVLTVLLLLLILLIDPVLFVIYIYIYRYTCIHICMKYIFL